MGRQRVAQVEVLAPGNGRADEIGPEALVQSWWRRPSESEAADKIRGAPTSRTLVADDACKGAPNRWGQGRAGGCTHLHIPHSRWTGGLPLPKQRSFRRYTSCSPPSPPPLEYLGSGCGAGQGGRWPGWRLPRPQFQQWHARNRLQGSWGKGNS